jgi:O-antigen chain-terminating methyltransferase
MTTPIAPLADRVQGIPLLGRPLALVLRMLQSGKAQARLITAETRVRELDAEARAMRARLDALESMAGALHREIGSVRDDVTATLDDRNRSLRGEVGHAVAGLRGEWRATLARDSRALERAAAALAAGRPADGLGVAALSAPGHYVAFENAFRGRWKVEERMRWYVPHLRALYHHGETRPVLDVGCGRGEFLLALKEAGLPGVGIDLNPAMVDTARAQGLDVTLADAVAHLRDREPGSLAAIASFHVIEHIPFEGVLHLIEAAKRALMPGGLLILETPNPENLAVGGCTFWYDPTHIRPLPPATMQFYVRTAGFEPVRIARFFLDTEGPDTATIDVPVQPGIDGPLDYGLLATKPRDPA